MLRRILCGLLIVIIVGFGGFAVLAYRPAQPSIAAMPTFAPELVAKGEILAGAGNCASKDCPAIGNAIFAATGARLRHIPITSEAILAALKNE